MRTTIPKEKDFDRKTYLVDAAGKTLGRLASKVAAILIGKHKPTFCSDQIAGDHVIVVNAQKIAVTGKKAETKMYKHYTGYPGGLRTYPYEDLQAKKPEEIIMRAVSRMLPKKSNGRKMLTHLRVYAGAEHLHAAQKPLKLEV